MTIIDATLIEAQCKSVRELQCIPYEKRRELAERINDLISADTIPLEHWDLLLFYLLNASPEKNETGSKR